MKKSLFLIGLFFQSLNSMQKMPKLSLGLPALRYDYSEDFFLKRACTVREKLMVSPSTITALALLQGRHLSSPTMVKALPSCGSIAGSSSVELSPSSDGKFSSVGFGTSFRASIRQYDESASAFSVVAKKDGVAIGSQKLARAGNLNISRAFPMKGIEFSPLVSGLDHEEARVAKAMLGLYFK